MLDPAELLGVARLLCEATGEGQPNDARLRRAVSTAYYAVFHTVLRAASQRFMGPGQETSAGYTLLYRGFEHQRMKMVCEALQASELKDKYKRHLRRRAVSQELRDFAGAFAELQEARQRADYDPSEELALSDVASIVDLAELAIGAFDHVAPEEQVDVLALLLVGARN